MLILFAALFVVGIIYFVAKAIGGLVFNPESRAWKMLIARLRERLKKQAQSQLVPWDHEMLGLLSLNRSVLKKPGFFDTSTEGVFTSIYHEPVLAYATQSSGQQSVTVARTSDREFIYRRKGRETEIWLDGQPFGVFVDQNLLSAGRSAKVLAQLAAGQGEAQAPVILGNQAAASITLPGRSSMPNPRVLTLLRDLNKEEESTLLALAVMKMTE